MKDHGKSKFTTLRVPARGHGGKAGCEARIKPSPGIVYVELDGIQERSSGFLVSDDVLCQEMPASGTVIASGHPQIREGEQVLMFLYSNQQIFYNFTQGAYKAKNQVRVVGISVLSSTGNSMPLDATETIISGIVGDGLAPKGKWVLVGRDDAVKESVGGILLTDASVTGSCKGTVLAVGEGADDMVTVGSRIHYAGGTTRAGIGHILDPDKRLSYSADDLIMVHEQNILAVIE